MSDTIIPIKFKSSAALRCAQLYHDWKSPVPFWKDYLDYTVTGFVCSRPTCFWMAKIIDLRPLNADGEPIGEKPDYAWFVRAAVGDLREMLFETLPGYLPKISFCRVKGEIGDVTPERRVYSMERFLKLVKGTRGKRECIKESAG
jgi:hypothetical protein